MPQHSKSMSANPTAVGPVVTNRNVAVTLPKLKYRTKKATWRELRQIIEIDHDFSKLTRCQQQQHDYEVFRHHMKQQYASTVDYILISKFHFTAVPAEATYAITNADQIIDYDNNRQRKWRAEPPLADVKAPKIILVPNDFPYYVEDSILHYVLFKLKERVTDAEIVDARKELSTKLKPVEILSWVNPTNLQSIPEIDHVHFLCQI